MAGDGDLEYTDDFVAGLEVMWGKGFLSPGGREEVPIVVEGIDLEGKEVLDVGCGIGGPTFALLEDHGAAHVVGVDVEQPVLDKAAAGAREMGLADRARFQRIEPGPLPFEDACFDVVFSKDAIIHVPDKPALFRDILRVLQPGGWVVLSDWFRGDQPFSQEMKDWIAALGLTFNMALLDDTAALLAEAGFAEVSTRDRNAWYAERSREEVAQMAGPDRSRLMTILGEEGAHNWIERARLKSIAVGMGDLRPGHLRGRKP